MISKLRLIFNIIRYTFTDLKKTTILDRETGKFIRNEVL
jgi:hypothetical protein